MTALDMRSWNAGSGLFMVFYAALGVAIGATLGTAPGLAIGLAILFVSVPVLLLLGQRTGHVFLPPNKAERAQEA